MTPCALEFRDVELRYQPHLPLVLKGLTLSVAPGTRLGVCGRTGSGKSTLLPRELPDDGDEQGRHSRGWSGHTDRPDTHGFAPGWPSFHKIP